MNVHVCQHPTITGSMVVACCSYVPSEFLQFLWREKDWASLVILVKLPSWSKSTGSGSAVSPLVPGLRREAERKVKQRQTSRNIVRVLLPSFCILLLQCATWGTQRKQYLQTYRQLRYNILLCFILWSFMRMYANHECCIQENEAHATATTISCT